MCADYVPAGSLANAVRAAPVRFGLNAYSLGIPGRLVQAP